MIFGGDGRGGFVVPEFCRTLDGIAAFARLLGLVARTRLTLSQIDARIPDAHLLKRSMPTPWAAKGRVMRTVVEAAGDRRSTPPTGCASSSRTAAGSWSCPTRRRRHPPVGRGPGRRRGPGAAGRVGRGGGAGRAADRDQPVGWRARCPAAAAIPRETIRSAEGACVGGAARMWRRHGYAPGGSRGGDSSPGQGRRRGWRARFTPAGRARGAWTGRLRPR